MSARQDFATAITTPPPAPQQKPGTAPRIVVLPLRAESKSDAAPGARSERLQRRHCEECSRGCSVQLHLTWTREADELIDSVIDAGYDTSPAHERALVEKIVVADMAAAGAQDVIQGAIDEIPSLRVIAIANTHEQERIAWEAGAHVVIGAPVEPEMLVRLLTRAASELERDRLLRDLAEKVRALRERDERRAEERGIHSTRAQQRALTMAAFKAQLLSETLAATCEQASIKEELARELCVSLSEALSCTMRPHAEPSNGPVSMELRRMKEILREGVHDVASIRRAMRDK